MEKESKRQKKTEAYAQEWGGCAAPSQPVL
jgi:hypothetical protein